MKRITVLTLKILVAFFFFIYSLIWLISPMISSHFIEKNITDYGLVLNESSSVRYNPFISQVKVEDFVLQKANKAVFSVEKLTVEMNLLQLIFQELHIKSVLAEGINGQIIIDGDNMIIAGVKIPSSSSKPETEKPEAEKPKEPTSKSTNEKPYQLVMPLLSISNSKIDLSLNNENLPIEINSLVIENFLADEHAQSASISTELTLEASKFKLAADASLINGQGEIESNVGIEHLDIAMIQPWLPENIRELSGLLSLKSEQTLQLNKVNTQVFLANTELSLSQFSVEQDKIQLSIDESKTNFSQVDIALTPDNAPNITGQGQLALTNIHVSNAEQPHLLLASMTKLAVDQIDLSAVEDLPTVTLNELVIDQTTISHDSQSDLPAFTQFSQLLFNNVVLSEQAADINMITLSDLVIDTHINAEKVLTSFAPLQSIKHTNTSATKPAATQDKEVKASETSSKAKFEFSLNDFHITNNAIINFNDKSVQPTFKQTFTVEELQFSQLNSRNPQLESVLKLRGKNNKYAHFDFDGVLQPFVKEPYYAVKGGIKEVSLPAVSSYIKEALNYEIKTGQLDFSIDTKLTGDKISGNSNILLRGIDFTAADDHEADSLKDQTAIPFSVALGMLKDSQGNVDLSLPLSGNTNDPSFGLSGFMTLLVKQATMMAAKDYLMTTFVPYANVVSVAMSAGKMLLKVRFNDLPFAPTHSDVSEDHQVFIKQFALLLKDKPDTQVTLCAVSTPEDVGLSLGQKITDKNVIEDLHQLSLKRIENFKHHIVDEYKIASSRLLLCTPQIDSGKKAQPRITFNVN